MLQGLGCPDPTGKLAQGLQGTVGMLHSHIAGCAASVSVSERHEDVDMGPIMISNLDGDMDSHAFYLQSIKMSNQAEIRTLKFVTEN